MNVTYLVVDKQPDGTYWIAASPNGSLEYCNHQMSHDEAKQFIEGFDKAIAWDLPVELRLDNVLTLKDRVQKFGSFYSFSDVTWYTLNQNRYVGTTKQIHQNIMKGQERTAWTYMNRDLQLLLDLWDFITTNGYVLGPLAPHEHATLGNSDILVRMVLDLSGG